MEFSGVKAEWEALRDEIDAAMKETLLKCDFIEGEIVGEFEKDLGVYCGGVECVTCGCGSDALLLALMACNIETGDKVICPSFTFTATAGAIARLGAIPVFCDISEDTWCLDGIHLEEIIATLASGGESVKAVVSVDIFGNPCEYDLLRGVCAEYNIPLIVDAAQSMGSKIDGVRMGSWGNFVCTSFFPSKPLGCAGDGGAVLTDRALNAARVRRLKHHGEERPGARKYREVGINSRLDSWQAMVLAVKMQGFEERIIKRNRIATALRESLSRGVVCQKVLKGSRSAWAQFGIRVGRRDEMADFLRRQGIPVNVYYPRGLHQEEAYRGIGMAPFPLSVTERLCSDIICLPIHPYLCDAEIESITKCIECFVGK